MCVSMANSRAVLCGYGQSQTVRDATCEGAMAAVAAESSHYSVVGSQ